MDGGLGSDLERLPGVLAATLYEDANRGPIVYLATLAGVDRGSLCEVVQALLRDRGFNVSADRVHIGAVPRVHGATNPLPDLSLESLEVHRTDGRIECTVRLRTEDRSYGGRAREPDSALGRPRAAALAVLVAVESMDPDLRLGLHGTRELDLFGHEALAVMVEATVGRASARLPGLTLVEQSIEEAAARATVAALRSWKA